MSNDRKEISQELSDDETLIITLPIIKSNLIPTVGWASTWNEQTPKPDNGEKNNNAHKKETVIHGPNHPN